MEIDVQEVVLITITSVVMKGDYVNQFLLDVTTNARE